MTETLVTAEKQIAQIQIGSAVVMSQTLMQALAMHKTTSPEFNGAIFDGLFECFSATAVLFRYFYTMEHGDESYVQRADNILASSVESFALLFISDPKVDKHLVANDMVRWLNRTLDFFEERLPTYDTDDVAEIVDRFYCDISQNVCRRLHVDSEAPALCEALKEHLLNNPLSAVSEG